MALWQLDVFKPATMLGFIRNVPPPPGLMREQWLPNQTISDLSYEYIVGANRNKVMAHVMGFDSEAPIHGRPGLGEKISGELPPIKRKARIGEKELIKFVAPRSGSADVDEAIRSVFTTAADLAQTIYHRLEWLSVQALSEPQLVYDDSGVEFSMDYGIPDAFDFNWTTGNDRSGAPVPGVTATANGLEDTETFDPIPFLSELMDRIQSATGFRPSRWVLSNKAQGLLLRNKKIRDMIRGTGDGVSSVMLTQAEVNALFAQYRLPTMTTYDVTVAKEEANGDYTDVRPMAENRSFFLPDFTVGNVLFGPTAESRVLYGTTQAAAAPGVWAETYGTTEPPAEWVKAAAVAFPTLPEAGKIGQATLFPA